MRLPPCPHAPGRLRLGSGVVLVVVFALLIILAAWAFSMSYLSTGATRQSARAQFRERCADLAQMALTETVHYLRTRVNNPDQRDIFEGFRADTPPDLTLDLDDLALTRAEALRYPEYSISSVEVHVPRRTSIGVEAEERVPYEAVGIARLSVTVSGPNDAQVTRLEEYGFRSVLTAPTRPLDMLTFFLGDPSGLLERNQAPEGVEGANAVMDWIDRKSAEAVAYYQAWEANAQDMANIARQGAQAAGYLGGIADRIEQQIMPLFRNAYTRGTQPGFWPLPPWQVVEPYQSSAGEFQVHRFAPDILVYTAAPSVDLRVFNLPVLVGTRIADTKSRNSASINMDEVLKGIYQTYKDYEARQEIPPEQQITEDLNKFEAASKQHISLWHDNARSFGEILILYKNFQDALIEVGGPEKERIQNRIRRLNAREQPWRNHFHFTQSTHPDGPAAAATAFLAQKPPPSGVVWVDDPKTRLSLDITGLTGRLQVISSGDMTVERATVADPNKDVLILVGYGEVELKGPVQAAIISWGGRYAARGQDLQGSLILNSIHKLTSDGTLSEILAGTLTRQDAIQSGPGGNKRRPPPAPESLHIAFSPVPPYRRPEER